jgi:hypothetical protein
METLVGKTKLYIEGYYEVFLHVYCHIEYIFEDRLTKTYESVLNQMLNHIQGKIEQTTDLNKIAGYQSASTYFQSSFLESNILISINNCGPIYDDINNKLTTIFHIYDYMVESNDEVYNGNPL